MRNYFVDENRDPPPPVLHYATPPRQSPPSHTFRNIARFFCAIGFGVFGIFMVCIGWAFLMDVILNKNEPTDQESVETVVLIILIGAFSTFMSFRWFRERRNQMRL